MKKDVLARRPDVVVIQFGINDSAVDVWKQPPATEPRVDMPTYVANLRHFVTTLKARGAQPVLMTPNPLRWTVKLRASYGKPPYDPEDVNGFNLLLDKYAAAVRKLAEEEGVVLVDVHRDFHSFDSGPKQSIDALLLDGMHPNEAGHQRIAALLVRGLNVSVGDSGDGPPRLIASIEKQTLFRNRDGKGKTWFHPRVCMVPDNAAENESGTAALMTLQEIGGSDYFGPVHWSMSRDGGRHWSDPEPIPALGRQPVPNRDDGLMAAVCDVTPQYHPPTGTVLALGHVVFYKGEYFARKEQLARYPVYVTRSQSGEWSVRKVLEWDDPRGSHIYTNNCGQRVVLPNGDIQMAFTFGADAKARMVAGVQSSFDGDLLRVKQVGKPMYNRVGRGLLEPSVTKFAEKFWITIRAEDNRGYVSVSDDGLNWEPQQPWMWDDGTPLEMSTTQQHWLTHSDGLFLVYTRKDPSNRNVIRWRSPLWVARVDPERRRLIKATERVVLPLVGDGVDGANEVALMGNFNVTNVSPHESWVTVGEWMPRAGYRGDVLLARIRWSQPNRQGRREK